MKLLEILQKELKEFPDGMLYAVQDDDDGEVKFGKHSHPTLCESGIWQRREDGKHLSITRLELAEDWDSAIVTKDMWEKHKVKQIIVNVSGLSVEEKQRVNEALATITGTTKLPAINPKAAWFFAPTSPSYSMIVTWGVGSLTETPTHTPQQVLEMAGMAKQGHVHADLMALYAEDAKTTDNPWELWQFKDCDGNWVSCTASPVWITRSEYRRKPKTHTVNGVEVPDFRFEPKIGEKYYVPDPLVAQLYLIADFTSQAHSQRKDNNLCYEPTEEGKQAAILHAKAWLGIA